MNTKTDLSKVVERWLHFVATDNSLFENIQLPDDFDLKEKAEDKCCVACSCQPGGCVTETRVNEDTSVSVKSEYTWQCGCQEICYSYEGKKVGRSQKCCCDGSKTFKEYRSVWVCIIVIIQFSLNLCQARCYAWPEQDPVQDWQSGQHRMVERGTQGWDLVEQSQWRRLAGDQ